MTDPDELYTLRAQYWLGHYNLCLEEGKAISRRPMSAPLKSEREEFVLRAQLALGQYDKVKEAANSSDASPGIKALGLRARYESTTDESVRQQVVDTLKAGGDAAGSSTLYPLTASHVLLQQGLVREALQCVHLGLTMEHLLVSLQIYLRMDRLDLAAQQLSLLKQADEDAVLTQLGGVYLAVATGQSTAPDASHHLNSLSEQYGPSSLILNASACAQMACGQFEAAESTLKDCSSEFGWDADTLVNTVVCYQHLGRPITAIAPLLQQLKTDYAGHVFVQGLLRVEGAFEREAVKYMNAIHA